MTELAWWLGRALDRETSPIKDQSSTAVQVATQPETSERLKLSKIQHIWPYRDTTGGYRHVP